MSPADDLLTAAAATLCSVPLKPHQAPLLAAAALALVATENFLEASALGRAVSAATAGNAAAAFWAAELEAQLEATALYAILEDGKASDIQSGCNRICGCLHAAAAHLPASSARKVAVFQGLLFGQWIPVPKLVEVLRAAREILPEGAMRVAVLARLLAAAQAQETFPEQPEKAGNSRGKWPPIREPIREQLEVALVDAVSALGARPFLNVVAGCVLDEATVERVLAAVRHRR
jgi:hypothetical protein